ncbi:hypothetical protein RI129_011632 [Pyrocoelia pectoralis]|uniref:Uncharacterized protein n=1 Tax=Pyrocoelia pectoralis TaxID=417401 RepID=A0AAN7Z7T2_9COLE
MLRLAILLMLLTCSTSYIRKKPLINTSLKVNRSSEISLKIVEKQHHLFIGRCSNLDDVLHSENIILNNDGKSQVNATIRMSVEGSVYITCVKVLDQVSDGEGAYPSFVGGGVGHNYVIFNVTAAYGRGFNFYVEIKGYSLEESGERHV